MNRKSIRKLDFGMIAWGALLIWWGILEMVPSLPAGSGPLGIGLILIGVNAFQHYSGKSTNLFSIGVGILTVLWGSLELAGIVLNLPFRIPVFAFLLVGLGVLFLIPGLKQNNNETDGGLS